MKLDSYLTLDKEIKENMTSRHIYECLYNDSILDDDKKFYKSKIDLIDAKIACFLECQTLLLKNIC